MFRLRALELPQCSSEHRNHLLLHPHACFPIPSFIVVRLPPFPRLDHLPSLPDTLLPHYSIAPLVECAATDSPVVPPRATFGGHDVGPKALDDGVMLNGLHPVGAAGGDLVDQGRRGVGHVDAPWGDDEEGVTVVSEGAKAFVVGPVEVENAKRFLLLAWISSGCFWACWIECVEMNAVVWDRG